jgi:hypothetical protein
MLLLDCLDLRLTDNLYAHSQVAVERDLTAGEHPPWEVDWRQEAAATWVPVEPER